MSLTPTQLLAALAALAVVLVVLWIWRASARRARRAAEAARASARLLSLTGRVVVGAVVLAGVQWLAFTYPGAPWLLRVAALGLPALFTSYTLTRALTVTTVDLRRGGRR
jgi:ABC-type xylose transport system permease subunit